MATTELEARSSYTPEQITQGLTALALAGGNSVTAEAQLAELGCPIPARTLCAWRTDQHPERYRDICNEVAPQIEARVIHLQRELAVRATETALLAADLERDRLSKGDVKDAASSARNLSTVAGIAVDKIMSLTGRPTSVIEHRTVDESLNKLKRLGLVVEGTAEEIPATTAEKPQAA